LLGPLDVEREFGLIVPQMPASILMISGFSLCAFFICTTAARMYRQATPIERRKIKWVVWGVHIAIATPGLTALLVLIDPDFTIVFYISIVSIAAFPLALLIAVLRFNLFDVDRVISHTAFYSTAAAVVIVGLVGLLPQITAAICPMLDLPVVVVQLGFSSVLVIAGALSQRSIVPAIEQRLHPQRFVFEARVQAVIGQLRNARSAGEVFQLLSDGMVQNLRPLSLGIYLRADGRWRTVRAIGRDVEPMLRDESPLLSAAARMGQMIKIEGGAAKRFAARDEYDRWLIHELGLALVLPLHRNADFIGVILLGRKSSGDVYVASECALLLAVSQAVSQRLASIEWQAAVDGARRKRVALQRYVPAVVAAEIVHGRHLGPVECEVSLLFVDIRGYSHYSEGRSVSDVFSTVNKYTQIVSTIAARHGGSIVEFNGDGMMVLFGAPKPMISKELRAVEAALHIHERMAVLREHARSATLSVGIGIATGPACVGSVRAVDRWIWTALGETTNRASRLQTLTRNVRAEIIIDEATWRRSSPRNSLFVAHEQQSLRGLDRKQNVFIKPLPERFAQGA
jgi:class 3 adenylate cyclase